MRAFVTGPTGFLGTNLLQELTRNGWEVIAFHRASSDLSELKKLPRITSAVGDVRDKKTLQSGMPEGLDAVFHTAGSVGFLNPHEEKEQYEINELGTRNVVDVALEKKVGRFIETSTILTYDYSGNRRISETSPPNADPKFAYIHSKYLAELEVDRGVKLGLDAVFLHPAAIFGAHDKATWSKMFRELSRGLPLPVAPPGAATLCHMRKVAQAHVSAFHRGRRGEHYVLGGADATMLQIMKKIAEIMGRPGPAFALPPFLFKLAGRIEYRASTLIGREPTLTPSMADVLCEKIFCDSDKAIAELGYDPSSLETMLRDCYEWMVSVKMLPAKTAA